MQGRLKSAGQGLFARTIVAAATLAALASCYDTGTAPPPPLVPAQIAVVSGSGQYDTVATTLPLALTVKVTDSSGTPVPGVTVGFQAVDGSGTVVPFIANTDADGLAGAMWTLGTTPGPQEAHASVVGIEETAVFSAISVAAAPSTIEVVNGDEQRAVAGTRLPIPLSVRVEDAYGNPLSSVRVTFTVISGGGVLEPNGLTDANGIASSWLTLGSSSGLQIVQASAEGVISPVTFTATALGGPPASMIAVSGDQQTAPAGRSLAAPLVVRVMDGNGNPVSGVPVSFAVTAGGGAVDSRAVVTDSTGVASTWLTLGPNIGVNTVSASVTGIDSVIFNANATAPTLNREQIAFGGTFEGPVDTEPVLWLINPDGSGLQRLTTLTAVYMGESSWSPDGSRLLFQDNGGSLYLINRDGSGRIRLPTGGSSPAWSPDGSLIAYDRGSAISVMNADGTSPRDIVSGDVDHPAWSPDGTRLVYSRCFGNLHCNIAISNADGSNEQLITTQTEMERAPAWSPDGTRIAFFRLGTNLWVMDADGSNQRNITDARFVTATNPSWSPDGTRIVFSGTEEDLDEQLWTIRPDGSGLTRLTNDPHVARYPSWSPN